MAVALVGALFVPRGAAGPEIGANDFQVSQMGPDLWGVLPAVAYNSLRDEYLVVWQGSAGLLNEFEIFVRRIDAATGQKLGEQIRISEMGEDGDTGTTALDPAVAYNAVDDEYLVAWWGEEVHLEGHEIYGQRLDGATGAEIGENDFPISSMGMDGFGVLFPRVVHNPMQNEYLVVWHGDPGINAEFEIYGQRLEGATGAEVGEDDFRISQWGPDGAFTCDAESPAAAYNLASNEYLVIWHTNGCDEPGVYGQRLDGATGLEIGENDFRIDVDGGGGLAAVAYNPDAGEYLVVWQEVIADIDPTSEIYGQRLEGATGEKVGEESFRISDMGPEGDDFVNLGAGGAQAIHSPVGGEYLVVWAGVNEIGVGSGETEIWAQRLEGATGVEVGANDFRLSEMGDDGVTSRDGFSPAVAYSPVQNTYLTVWWGDDTQDEKFDVYGQLYVAGLFEDDFEDDEVASYWTLERGTWTEDEGLLQGVPDEEVGEQVKARAIALDFAGCELCTVGAQLEARNGSGTPAETHVRLLGWYESRKTNLSVTLKPLQDKVVYRQKEDGVTLVRRDFFTAIEEDTFYEVGMTFDGSRFQVLLDGAVIFDEVHAGTDAPLGTVGFQARSSDIAIETIGVGP